MTRIYQYDRKTSSDPGFRIVSESEPVTENGITFRFVVYEKIKPDEKEA